MTRIMSLLALLFLGVVGCSSDAEPPVDFGTNYADLTRQLEAMCVTLEAIPDEFDLGTRKKAEAAQELLDSTAAKLEVQALEYNDAWEAFRAHGNVSGDLDYSLLDKHIEALDRFEAEWERISKNNDRAYQALWETKKAVDDVTSA